MKKVVCIVLCLLLFSTCVSVFAESSATLPEPAVYYDFDGEDVLAEKFNDGKYDGKAALGDPDCFDGAYIAQADSMEGYGKAAVLVEKTRAEGSFIQLPNNIMPENLDGDFTFSFWFKADTGTLYTTVFCFGYTGCTYAIKLSFNENRQMYVYISDAENVTFEMGRSGNLVDATSGWHFYTLTCKRGADTDTVKFYIDGTLIEQKTDAKLPVYSEITNENNAFNMIGQAFWPDPNVGGLLDEFRIYTSELTPEEITTLKTNPFGLADEKDNNDDKEPISPVTVDSSIAFALTACLSTIIIGYLLKTKKLCK